MRKLISTILFMITITTTMHAADETFTLSTIDGKMLRFTGTPNGVITDPYRGKIVFIEFWGTWCGPCLMSIPHHVKLQEKYKDNLAVIAMETSPSVTKDELLKYVADPSTHIDMSKVSYYLSEKAKSPAQKASLKEPIETLKKFIASKTKINYDVVASAENNKFVDYIAQRAGWKGYIPFLVILDGEGNAAAMVPGMPSEEKLEGIIQNILSKKKK